MSNSPRLLIRCDANHQIGFGHIMRCLSLALTWRERGGETVLVMASPPAEVRQRIAAEGLTLETLDVKPGTPADIQQTINLANQRSISWIVLDSYSFGSAYQVAVKSSGRKLLVVDDNEDTDRYVADLVLNPNLHAEEHLYRRRDAGTRLLRGPQFALLRPEFQQWRHSPPRIPVVAERFLITCGGSDSSNLTEILLAGLECLPARDWQATVILGGGNPRRQVLANWCRVRQLPIQIEHNVHDMPGRMAEADLAVSAAGGTALELAWMQVPSILVAAVENQVAVARKFGAVGGAHYLGLLEHVTPDQVGEAVSSLRNNPQRRLALSSRGRTLVDGRGAERVVRAILDYPSKSLGENDETRRLPDRTRSHLGIPTT